MDRRSVDTSVGGVRLEVWKDGGGVVTRRGPETATPVPHDPAYRELIPLLPRFAATGLIGSAVACAAGLFFAGDRPWPAVFALTAALVLGLLGGVCLLVWASSRRRVPYVVLSRAAVGEYRVALAKARRSLGDAPTRVAEERAAERLWELAQALAPAESSPDAPEKPSA
ncbi:hypothetical protein [Catellatospora sp. NPDC049609]|uniref:hypothetical protein n=1 Tax=Catellatospora sp. NPDC049609 TaxID=3155505 RepID=UPI00343AABE2